MSKEKRLKGVGVCPCVCVCMSVWERLRTIEILFFHMLSNYKISKTNERGMVPELKSFVLELACVNKVTCWLSYLLESSSLLSQAAFLWFSWGFPADIFLEVNIFIPFYRYNVVPACTWLPRDQLPCWCSQAVRGLWAGQSWSWVLYLLLIISLILNKSLHFFESLFSYLWNGQPIHPGVLLWSLKTVYVNLPCYKYSVNGRIILFSTFGL